MALNLIGERRLEVRMADEISALLERPMRYGPEWTYALSQCSGFGWHDSGLIVRFDAKNRVIATRFDHMP